MIAASHRIPSHTQLAHVPLVSIEVKIWKTAAGGASSSFSARSHRSSRDNPIAGPNFCRGRRGKRGSGEGSVSNLEDDATCDEIFDCALDAKWDSVSSHRGHVERLEHLEVLFVAVIVVRHYGIGGGGGGGRGVEEEDESAPKHERTGG